MNKLTHKFETGYVESDELIGKPHVQSVFRFLKAMHCEYGETFECEISLIASKCNMSRNKVSDVLEDLSEMKLISCEKLPFNKGIGIVFNADHYVSLISMLNTLSGKERENFINCFHKKDFETLENRFHYKVIDDAGERLGTIFAKPCSFINNVDEKRARVAHKSTTLAHISTRVAHKRARVVEICATIWDPLLDFIDQDALVSTMIAQKSTIWGDPLSDEQIDLLKSGNKEFLENLPLLMFQQGGCSCFNKGLFIYEQLYKNKNKDKEKIIYERSEYNKGGKDKKDFELEDEETSSSDIFKNFSSLSDFSEKEREQETEDTEQELPAEQNENNGYHLDIVELKPEEPFGKGYRKKSKTGNGSRNFPAFQKRENPYACKPYYIPEELKKIINTPELCTDSPARLFLYYLFYQTLYFYEDFRRVDQSQYESVYDEDDQGEEYREEEATINELILSGCLIPVTEMEKIMFRAAEDFEDAIEKGFLDLDMGRELKLNIPKDHKLPDADFLLDWKHANDIDGNDSVMVSLEGVRDIEAEDIQYLKAPKGREEVRQENRNSREMIRYIMEAPEKDLTPVELVIKRFFEKFGNFDETYHMGPFVVKGKVQIPADEERGLPAETVETASELQEIGKFIFLGPLARWCEEAGVKHRGFYMTLLKPEDRPEKISCKGTVFSYTNVTNVNAENGWKTHFQLQNTK